MPDPVRIALISGSLRKESYNTRLIRFVGEQVKDAGVEIDEISLLDLDLPLMNEDLEKNGHPANVLELKQRMIAADGLLVGCPEYNGSITPALKNAIDWASRPREGEPTLACFRGKVAGLLAASPGRLGGIRGLRHVRTILSGIGTLVVPTEFGLSGAGDAFDETGHLKDEGAAKMAVAVGESVVKIARAFKKA
jgi:chromate reductase